MCQKSRTHRTVWRIFVLIIYTIALILNFTFIDNNYYDHLEHLWMFAYGRLVYFSHINMVRIFHFQLFESIFKVHSFLVHSNNFQLDGHFWWLFWRIFAASSIGHRLQFCRYCFPISHLLNGYILVVLCDFSKSGSEWAFCCRDY